MNRYGLSVNRDPLFLYKIAPAIFYVLVFLQPQFAFPIHAFMLAWSYFLIIRKGSLLPVVTLIIYARAFVGFAAASGPVGYTELSIMTNYVPAALYLFFGNTRINSKLTLKEYAWTFLYGAILIIYSFVGADTALLVLGDRLLPFFLLLIFLLRGVDVSRLREDFVPLMRYLVLATIFVSLSPSYLASTLQYLESGVVFGESSASSIYLGGNLRGIGPFWDPRILGTMCSLYLAVSLNSEKRSKLNVDSIFALAGVVMSLSRGSMALSAVILFFTLSRKITPVKAVAGLLSTMAVFLFGPLILETVNNTLFVVNGVNALDQRSEFFQFAFSQFLSNPFGSGIGAMRDLPGGVYALGNLYFSVTDAYIAILLAEIGLLGFVVFILSFRELIWSNNAVSRGLFFGFLVQMIGTDVGDFGMYYYVIVIIAGSMRADANCPRELVGRNRPATQEILQK